MACLDYCFGLFSLLPLPACPSVSSPCSIQNSLDLNQVSCLCGSSSLGQKPESPIEPCVKDCPSLDLYVLTSTSLPLLTLGLRVFALAAPSACSLFPGMHTVHSSLPLAFAAHSIHNSNDTPPTPSSPCLRFLFLLITFSLEHTKYCPYLSQLPVSPH